MKDTIRRQSNRLALRRHQMDSLCLPKFVPTGDVDCYVHGSVIVIVSPYANHRMNYKSMKVILEEFRMHAAMEKKRKQLSREEVELWKQN